MGQRADSLEREILDTRHRMGQTIDRMEHEFRRAVDWKARVMDNPVPYVVGALGVAYLLVGGPRRTAAFVRSRRPKPKTRVEKLVESLPEPLAQRFAPVTHDIIEDLSEIPDNLRKTVRELQKERAKQQQKEEEERLKRAAKATMVERLALRAAEAAGAAAAGIAVKVVTDRLLKDHSHT